MTASNRLWGSFLATIQHRPQTMEMYLKVLYLIEVLSVTWLFNIE